MACYLQDIGYLFVLSLDSESCLTWSQILFLPLKKDTDLFTSGLLSVSKIL